MTTLSIADNTRSCSKKRKKPPNTLYHVTPPDNYISICERGVDPAFSQSHPERVYFVEKRALHWAIPHVSKKHNCPAENLIIFKVRGGKRVRAIGAGLWYCDHPKVARYYDDARYHS